MNEAHCLFWVDCCPQKSNEPNGRLGLLCGIITSDIIMGCCYIQNESLLISVLHKSDITVWMNKTTVYSKEISWIARISVFSADSYAHYNWNYRQGSVGPWNPSKFVNLTKKKKALKTFENRPK